MTIRITTLANGIKVITDHMDHLKTAAVGVWVDVGSRDERKNESGMTHLLEHMAFKGTQRRSAQRIAEEIEAVGGDLNAATGVESTHYHARVLAEDVPLAIHILGDILQNSVFDDEELKREKHVILQEIGAARDTPDDAVFDLFQETAWPNQAIGRPILGSCETVEAFSSDDVRSYLGAHYVGERIVIVAAGAVDHDAIIRDVELHFGGFSRGSRQRTTPARYVSGVRLEARDLMETQIVVGFEGRAHRHVDIYAVQLLSAVLGGGMASRLFQEIRERRGLCYSIYALHWAFSDTGLFAVHAATNEADTRQLMEALATELVRASADIDETELRRARAQTRAAMMMALESPAARAGQIARQMKIWGEVLSFEEIERRIAAVTVENVRQAAAELFIDRPATLAAVGRVGNVMSLDEIHERLGTGSRKLLYA